MRVRRAPSPRFGTALLLVLVLAILGSACFEETSERSTEGEPKAQRADGGSGDLRPSIVLVVVESLRTDVVASHGRDYSSPFDESTLSATPNIDALSDTGFRYAWAIAASPETAASHASIFSGLPADRHGVGMWAQPTAPGSLTMLAESLRDAGYQTAGFSENPMVGPEYGLAQGFETFEVPDAAEAASPIAAGKNAATRFGLVDRVRRWHSRRDPSRPFFLFVNLFDPHLPLHATASDPFLPDGVGKTRLSNLLATELRREICRKLPDPGTLEIIRGLYKSQVAAADRKLGTIVALTRTGTETKPITIVTADHGTHLGEGRLLGHQFAVDNRVLRVPLVVDGSPLGAGIVETPIAQRRLASSIRCWSGDSERCAEGLPGTEPDEPEAIVSIFGDERAELPPAAVVDTGSLGGYTNHARAICDRAGGPFGRAVSFIRPPMKMVWRVDAPPRLYDLGWDSAERSNQMERQPAIARTMHAEVGAFVRARQLDRVLRDQPEGPLLERAAAAYDAARAALLADAETQTDAVWFTQLLLRDRDDPELERWVEEQIPLHREDPFFPIIAPAEAAPKPLPSDPGHGLIKWGVYLLAAVADPEPIALRYLNDYLGMTEMTGYILTHQVSALEWARAKHRPLASEVYDRLPVLLARIEEEHAEDTVFSDLWVERAAFLTAFGEPTSAQIERWTSVLVENHLGNGDWGDGATEIHFDGQSMVGDHEREHARGMAMIVLAHYLATQPGAG